MSDKRKCPYCYYVTYVYQGGTGYACLNMEHKIEY
jgi:hypothetical protein